MNVKVVCTRSDWTDTLASLARYDFGHTYDFHVASALGKSEVPILFVAYEDNVPVACWPVLRRAIPGTSHFDFTSVYGYCGPLLGCGAAVSAVKFIIEKMAEYGAVSLFTRMHPLFPVLPVSTQEFPHVGDVVVIKVNGPGNPLLGYRGSHRREIVNAQKAGVTIRVGSDACDIEDFTEIYHQAMDELNAAQSYYFGAEFYNSLIAARDFKAFVISAVHGGTVIASSIFIVTGDIMQYFLSGTLASYRKLAPSKLIIAHAHQMAREMGLTDIVLGGGVGGAADALMKFKKGFSSLSLPYYLVKKVLDPSVYQELSCARGGIPETSYFPAYRRP